MAYDADAIQETYDNVLWRFGWVNGFANREQCGRRRYAIAVEIVGSGLSVHNCSLSGRIM